MAGAARLSDLDDACLCHVLSFLHPLPDRFNLAASCRRLRDLALDRRTWLVVSHTRQDAVVGIPRQHHEQFPTLDEAIQASRPGDTILLMPGEPYCVSGAVIPWPLHIMGGGSTPEQTVLISPRGARAALDFRSSGRLFNLAICSELGSCITHRRGRLTVEQCSLSCEAGGLPHLSFPIATLASSPPALGYPSEQPLESRTESGRAAAAAGVQGSAGDMEGVGPGVLSLVETKIKGSGSAIQLLGTGGLADVRFIYLPHSTLFWFTVNSTVPGTRQQAQHTLPAPLQSTPLQPAEQQESKGEMKPNRDNSGPCEPVCGKRKEWCGASGEGPLEASQRGPPKQRLGSNGGGLEAADASPCCTPPTPALLPAWMQSPPFDPLSFQQRVQERESRLETASGSGGALQKKAQLWSRRHAAALGGSSRQ